MSTVSIIVEFVHVGDKAKQISAEMTSQTLMETALRAVVCFMPPTAGRLPSLSYLRASLET